MPTKTKTPCRKAGCPKLVEVPGYCPAHLAQVRKVQDAERGSAHARGYGWKWQQASKGWLRRHPLCQCPECQEGKLRLRPASVVDHIAPHKGDMALFWNPENWQSMHSECHNKKTATEDGGFGHKKI
jgi:5-methylcytosine-specific restriction protein A